jgi:exopolyphosphatase/guanosine-5'-triphosphate,3'-diphosphate pyrophosphatase
VNDEFASGGKAALESANVPPSPTEVPSPPKSPQGAAPDMPLAPAAAVPWRESSAVGSARLNEGEWGSGYDDVYGALDLGTNNCRLLLARPSRRGFRVVDAFSRIIRLGEGVSQSGRLSEAAMRRTIDALRVCASKMARNRVERARLVATEACRIAENGPDFLDRVREQVGLDIEILTREDEAKLAVSGCASLVDHGSNYVLVFDIGGGSSELIWLDLSRRADRGGNDPDQFDAVRCMAAWTSLPVGVVTLAERFGGRLVTPDVFEAMVDYVIGLLAPFEAEHRFADRIARGVVHLLGTSGTVTTVAGIQLQLPRYDRSRVDGCWLQVADVQRVTYDLLGRSYEERVAEPCIGRDRADLVLAGCAILEALLRTWPCERLRVADRGLREGILTTLMREDGVYRAGRRRRRGGRRR